MVTVHPELREEFEEKFATISVHVAKSAEGNLSVTILKPSRWARDEYAMISQWADEESLKAFAGENWNEAVIPNGMGRFIQTCSVHHFEHWG